MRPPSHELRLSPGARKLVTLSVVAGALGLLLAGYLVFVGDVGPLGASAWAEVFVASLFVGLAPYGYFRRLETRRIVDLEQQFPEFLRDVATNHNAGLTLPKAIEVASHGSYGALTPEVQRMADQLSWNVPLEEALKRFGEQTRAPLIQRTIGLIIRSSHSGGNTGRVLLAAARDARELKTIELERRTGMGMYIAIIYLTFIIFLGIVATLYLTLVPQILASTEAAAASGASALLGTGRPVPRLENFRHLYLMAAAIQGLGNGLVAGLLTNGRPGDGVRHSVIMVAAALVTFHFL